MYKKALVILMTISLVACTKEIVTTRTYPRVLSSSVTNVTDTGAQFKGEIIYTPGTITDYGFVWADAGFPTYQASNRISLGSRNTTGTFDAVATIAVSSTKHYSMRAYAKTDDYVVYGGAIDF